MTYSRCFFRIRVPYLILLCSIGMLGIVGNATSDTNLSWVDTKDTIFLPSEEHAVRILVAKDSTAEAEEEAKRDICKTVPGCETLDNINKKINKARDLLSGKNGSKEDENGVVIAPDERESEFRYATPSPSEPWKDSRTPKQIKTDQDRFAGEMFSNLATRKKEIDDSKATGCMPQLKGKLTADEYNKNCGDFDKRLAQDYEKLYIEYRAAYVSYLKCNELSADKKDNCMQQAKAGAERDIPSSLRKSTSTKLPEHATPTLKDRLSDIRVRVNRETNTISAELSSQANSVGKALKQDLNDARAQYEVGEAEASGRANAAMVNSLATGVSAAAARQRAYENSIQQPQENSGGGSHEIYKQNPINPPPVVPTSNGDGVCKSGNQYRTC